MTTCQLQTVKVYETYIEGPGGREFCIPICRTIGPIFELETAVSLLLPPAWLGRDPLHASLKSKSVKSATRKTPMFYALCSNAREDDHLGAAD